MAFFEKTMTIEIGLLIFLCVQLVIAHQPIIEQKSKIAIIGAGISGTSCANFLNDLLSDSIEIDIYEKNRIGGRLRIINHKNNIYEIGGVNIGNLDKYMEGIVNKFGLIKQFNKKHKNSFIIYDGEKLITTDTIYTGDQIMQWGNLTNFQRETAKKISKIYKLQKKGKSFESVDDLLYNGNTKLPAYAKTSIEKFLDEIYLINEKPMNIYSMLHYGQSEVPALLGYFSTSFIRHDAYTIEGGNYRAAKKILEHSKANIYYNRVQEIKRVNTNQSIVSSIDKNGNSVTKIYDIVIIATPLAENIRNLNFLDYENLNPITGNYFTIVSTILEGNLRGNLFGSNVETIQRARHIILQNQENLLSISKLLTSGDNNNKLWKILSKNSLSTKEIKELFGSRSVAVNETKWLAYPEYKNYGIRSVQDGKFELETNLYYINCIEWAASSMEMSLIGAKNVALMISEKLQKE